MTTYTAEFSTGTITRKTKNVYLTAAAWINKNTGEIRNETFSRKIAKANLWNITGLLSPIQSGNERAATIKRNAEILKSWKHEIVSV